MLEGILRENDAQNQVYGVDSRWRREVANGYVDVLADDGGDSMHQCFMLIRAWLQDHAGDSEDRTAEMPAHVLRFLLEHGSLMHEIYACMVMLRSLEESDLWVHAAYWARIVQCLYILCMHDMPGAAHQLSGVLHSTLDFSAFEREIAQRVHEYFHVHGVVRTEEMGSNGYSPMNSVTPPASEAGD
eukprot:GHVU01192760.1.p1 GENE.GHVU01192760.1~~GHVU01192760.1.p1  ORF type:complete len:186 (-),score=17.18 GHVU01192760.1:301-858(-)